MIDPRNRDDIRKRLVALFDHTISTLGMRRFGKISRPHHTILPAGKSAEPAVIERMSKNKRAQFRIAVMNRLRLRS